MWYEKTTQGIKVAVRPLYRSKDSSPREGLFVWSYDVTISNSKNYPVQLMNRHWKITDADNQVQKVNGPGVVGERPVIGAGDEYTYSSFTHLTTSSGNMVGRYEMIDEDGETFSVEIPQFLLDLPVRLVTPENTPTL